MESQTTRQPGQIVPLLTKKEAAEMLKCSLGHVSNAINSGELLAIRFGRRCVRISPMDVEAYIAKHSKTAA